MPDTPITTFTLYSEKVEEKNEIFWECKINREFLLNGIWKLEIKSIALTEIKVHVKQEPSLTSAATFENDSPIFEISCNLVANNFRWFESIIDRYNQKQTYKEHYPIEFVQTKPFKTGRQQLLFFKGKKHRLSSPSNDDLMLVMKPTQKSYKFNTISCSATVMISLYRENDM